MKIKPKRYAESLVAICKGKSTDQIDGCSKEFLSLLASRGLLRFARLIIESMRDCIAREAGVSRITITSAQELEKGEREMFEKMLYESYGKKSSLAFTVDPQLVSGFRIRVDDRVIDASLSGQLHSLRDYLKQSALAG